MYIGINICNFLSFNSYTVFTDAHKKGHRQKLFVFVLTYTQSRICLVSCTYFVQATIGPCNKDKPGVFDLVGKAKWDAWNKLGAMDQVCSQILTW